MQYSPIYSASPYSHSHYSQPQYSQPHPIYSAPSPSTSVRSATPTVSHPVVSSTNRDALVNVQVPANALVFLDEYQTKSKGERRRYLWKNLQPGHHVQCRIRAEMMVNGKKVQQTKQVDLRAGTESNLVFDFKKIETTLTLRVPTSAKVYLGRSYKKGSGALRTYTSTKLAAGQRVSNFPVRVSLVRNGQAISKVENITLTSGESKTLEFLFDRDTPVALVR